MLANACLFVVHGESIADDGGFLKVLKLRVLCGIVGIYAIFAQKTIDK